MLAFSRLCADLTFDAVVLQQQIARARKDTVVFTPPTTSLNDRSTSFALRGRALVVATPVAVLGSVRNKAAQVPLLGRLHREHAVIARHDRKYWLTRPPHHDDLVAVNGADIQSPCALVHGDHITLGAHAGRGRCELTFLRPDPATTTAVLRQEKRAVITPSGDAFDKIVLLDDYLTVGRAETAHLPSPRLACPEVRFTWSDLGRTASAVNGRVYEETPEGDWNDPPTPLIVPCRLIVTGDEGLAEQIIYDYRHGGDIDERLDLFDPYQPR
jgi:hypothetical protein